MLDYKLKEVSEKGAHVCHLGQAWQRQGLLYFNIKSVTVKEETELQEVTTFMLTELCPVSQSILISLLPSTVALLCPILDKMEKRDVHHLPRAKQNPDFDS